MACELTAGNCLERLCSKIVVVSCTCGHRWILPCGDTPFQRRDGFRRSGSAKPDSKVEMGFDALPIPKSKWFRRSRDSKVEMVFDLPGVLNSTPRSKLFSIFSSSRFQSRGGSSICWKRKTRHHDCVGELVSTTSQVLHCKSRPLNQTRA